MFTTAFFGSPLILFQLVWTKRNVHYHLPCLVLRYSVSDWMQQIFSQSEALPRSLYRCFISSIEFLQSFFRRDFTGKVQVIVQLWMSAAFSGYMHWCKIQCKNFLGWSSFIRAARSAKWGWIHSVCCRCSSCNIYAGMALPLFYILYLSGHFLLFNSAICTNYGSEILLFYECQIVTFTLIWFIGRFWWCFILWSSCSVAIWLRSNFLKKL